MNKENSLKRPSDSSDLSSSVMLDRLAIEQPADVASGLNELRELAPTESKDLAHIDKEKSLLHEEKIAQIESFRQDISERKHYAGKAFVMVSIYLIVVALFFFLAGLECAPFHCSDAVLITLLSTTTTTVIGIFLLVMQYLFHKR